MWSPVTLKSSHRIKQRSGDFNIEGVRPTLQLARKLAQLREPLEYGICARRSFRGLSVLERKM